MHVLRTAVRRRQVPVTFLNQPLRASIRFYSTALRTCPSCSAPLQSSLPTCLKCSYIAPLPSSTTYFDMLDVSNAQNPFRVDIGSLKRRFLEAQRVCHPDAWSGKGERQQNIAASQSSAVNEAYKTLSSPLQRAQYILMLQGLPPLETDKLEDRDFVMEVMEIMEEIESASSIEDIEALRVGNKKNVAKLHDKIEALVGEKKWEEVAAAAIHLKYLDNIETAAKAKEDELSS